MTYTTIQTDSPSDKSSRDGLIRVLVFCLRFLRNTPRHLANNLSRPSWLLVLELLTLLSATFVILWQNNLFGDLFSDTTLTGGDTGAHIWGPDFIKRSLFPELSGWTNDWFGGLPAFTFYPVIPNYTAATLSFIIPDITATKIVTVLGLLALPFGAFFLGRGSGFKRPIPIVFALFSLIFIYDDNHTIWGGNAFANLAGEYAETWGLAFCLFYFGALLRGIKTGGWKVRTAVLLAFTVLCHPLAGLFATLITIATFLVMPSKKMFKEFKWLAWVTGSAFLLSSFWVVPFLLRRSYLTGFEWQKEAFYADFLFRGDFHWIFVMAFAATVVSIVHKIRLGRALAVSALIIALIFRLVDNGTIFFNRLLPLYYLCIILLAALGVGLFMQSLFRYRQKIIEPSKKWFLKIAIPFVCVVSTFILFSHLLGDVVRSIARAIHKTKDAEAIVQPQADAILETANIQSSSAPDTVEAMRILDDANQRVKKLFRNVRAPAEFLFDKIILLSVVSLMGVAFVLFILFWPRLLEKIKYRISLPRTRSNIKRWFLQLIAPLVSGISIFVLLSPVLFGDAVRAITRAIHKTKDAEAIVNPQVDGILESANIQANLTPDTVEAMRILDDANQRVKELFRNARAPAELLFDKIFLFSAIGLTLVAFALAYLYLPILIEKRKSQIASRRLSRSIDKKSNKAEEVKRVLVTHSKVRKALLFSTTLLTVLVVFYSVGLQHRLNYAGWHNKDNNFGLHIPGLHEITTKALRHNSASWAEWNYSGLEKKTGIPGKDKGPGWSELSQVIENMKRVGEERGCGRSLWEYQINRQDSYGVNFVRNMLPYWTDSCITAIDGLYTESSATSPYYYISLTQVSAQSSEVVRGLSYVNRGVGDDELFNRGVRHLQILGVRYLIAGSEKIINLANAHIELTRIVSFPEDQQEINRLTKFNLVPHVVYEVSNSDLVVPLQYLPAVVGESDWLEKTNEWWIDPNRLDVHYLASGPDGYEKLMFHKPETPQGFETHKLQPIQEPQRQQLIPAEVSKIQVFDERIEFQVDQVGVPILVKVSYFPNWTVSGAMGPYRASPNWMVVIPTKNQVVLSYKWSRVEYLGYSLSGLGIVLLSGVYIWERRRRLEKVNAR